MMLQAVFIALLFLAALAYLGRVLWRAWRPPAAGAGCAKGCGTCEVSSVLNRRLAEAEARAQH